MEIYIDGGIRRGTDVIKALALGATAVGIGRPFLYSMAAGYGEEGVRRMVQILRGADPTRGDRDQHGPHRRDEAVGAGAEHGQHSEVGAGFVQFSEAVDILLLLL